MNLANYLADEGTPGAKSLRYTMYAEQNQHIALCGVFQSIKSWRY